MSYCKDGMAYQSVVMECFSLILCTQHYFVLFDIPATRKVCGFPGFKAKLGCSKYSTIFPCDGFGEPTLYSGFDRHDWVARTMKNHLKSVKEIEVASRLTEKTRLEKIWGSIFRTLSVTVL